MLKKLTASICLLALLLIPSMTQAQNSNRMIVTMVVASNNGSDFNMDNDAYRDKLTQLFSYSSYVQSDLKKLDMALGETQNLALLEGYNLSLTLKEDTGSSIVARAVITKDNKNYIDTELSIAKPGIFFMGGPTLSTGDLILILENGY
ncbi:MAG TPA: hypothetical protein PLY88_07720 [Candidatus Omnitrophota bacterium]|nr:hypothetical protein [Candidatus Omnitrophota bacterium]HRK62417.1 hypothetical protein [Candidatus Omnitrophota bacterium]